MRSRISHRGAAPNSAASTSTSSKRDPNDEPPAASEESGNKEQEDASLSSGSEWDSNGLMERERVLADVPFGELQRARADWSLATQGVSAAAAAQKKAHRESRKRPMEISTNVRPPRLREVI